MANQIVWAPPFDNSFGNDMVYRVFSAAGNPYAVGFEELQSQQALTNKGINLNKAMPQFRFPQSGVWAIVFDEIDLVTLSFNNFQHRQLPGCAGGRVLFNVASIINEHYTVSNAGAYVFSAAPDKSHTRKTDLTGIYNGLLGLSGRKSKILGSFPGWDCYSDFLAGGRGYVITTQSY
ncbi:hypothetical protein [Serratia marcescens]|uniref:hypothetical protein n=1 Tax=Serratia marcescens TaxID=615 RepID=UPI0021793AA8|nr:hypothetical protein [Serratia marcescens]CAI1527061.1 Uncharacterised protein [Serratia marcescens]CAI1585203.1 Uncharacterised protein [Serratia marcescens]